MSSSALFIMKNTILALALFFTSCKIFNNSGYTALMETNKSAIKPFNVLTIDSIVNYKQDFIAEEMDGDKLKEILKVKPFTWVYLWAPWCPHLSPAYFDGIERVEKRYNGRVKPIIISISYQLNTMHNFLKESKFDKKVYILSYAAYGDNMTPAMNKFHKQIAPKGFFTRDKHAGHYLFKGTQLVYASYDMDSTVFKKYIGNY